MSNNKQSMNKIELAIYACELQITQIEKEILSLSTQLKVYEKQLKLLKDIESDSDIPHFLQGDNK